jgi:2,3-dihydroxyphenylpropionate 1,2-dioxygenase
MQLMMACASHSPLMYLTTSEPDLLRRARGTLAALQHQIEAFDPQLVVLFGCDHYGGQQMFSMPAFCIGVEATALADVGGTAGKLNVPREIAVAAVKALRKSDVDVAVSYDMNVDHGFSQMLTETTGAVDRYPVLPIFVSCLQPPYVPFKRARALGTAMASYIASLDLDRVLILGTGGLSHNPSVFFPPIDAVSEEWRPYVLNGPRQNEVPQQAWIDYEIAAHTQAAQMLAVAEVPLQFLSIHEDWDREFLDLLCTGELADFNSWEPETIVADHGIGAMEILTWVAAAQCLQAAAGTRPHVAFHAGIREIGISFGVVEAAPALVTLGQGE